MNINNLLERYKAQEDHFTVVECTSKYEGLVTASTNQNYPVQRWFHLKEAFSLDLLPTLLKDWNIDIGSLHRILDPFCGIGTSLLALQQIAKQNNRNDLLAIGFERNPFLHFVAQTKIQWHRYNSENVKRQAAYLLNGCYRPCPTNLPELSTLHREDVYNRERLLEILSFKNAIDFLPYPEKDPIVLGWASTLENLSGIRKDGRALRISKKKKIPDIPDSFMKAWDDIANDLTLAPSYFNPINTQIFLGDGRRIKGAACDQHELRNFDLIIYSPPYLNNIDYSEVYKIELWMCGFINSFEAFRNLRLNTFRSHPSLRFHEPITMLHDSRMNGVAEVINDLIEALPKNKDLKWRTDLFQGYFDDMYISLKKQFDLLLPGGWIFCVVGNSLHGPNHDLVSRVPVASDLIIAQIAETLGFEVKAIQIARLLKRRLPEYKYLRESIVVMQKPIRSVKEA